MFYINYKEKRSTVTVNEFKTKDEAEKMLDTMKESLANGDTTYEAHEYYVSNRCAKAWKDRELLPGVDGEEEEEISDPMENLDEAPVTIDDKDPDDVYVDAYLETWETPAGKVREALVGNEDEEYIPTEDKVEEAEVVEA